jgi:hypothetical protein
VERLFAGLPGGQLGFLIAVNVLVFFLGCFIDFFEIAFIVIPLLVTVAEKLNIDLVWFGVVIGMNLQASFLSPPFGFALFYLRSVAPRSDYSDRVTNKRIAGVMTAQIYKGSILFVGLQLIMLAMVIAFPTLVTGSLDKAPAVNLDTLKLEAETGDYGRPAAAEPDAVLAPEPSKEKTTPAGAGAGQEEDPMEAVRRAIEQEAKQKK